MNIHLHDVFGYIQNLAIENTKLKEENIELKNNRMDAGRFYAAALNVEAVLFIMFTRTLYENMSRLGVSKSTPIAQTQKSLSELQKHLC